MGDKKVNLTVTADVKDAEKGIKSIQTNIGGMKNNAGQAFDFMKSKWLAASAAIAAGAVAIRKALDFAEVFSSFKEQTDLLASNFGINAEKLISKVREATNGTISNVNIVKSATEAFALGAARNINDVAKMMQIADVQGKATGKSMQDAFNVITDAVAKGRPGMLAQIGFSKELIQSWENEAAATGGVLDSQTLLNKVMEVGAKSLEKTSAAGLSFNDKLNIIKASADNVKLAIGEGVVRSFDPFVEKIKNFAQSEIALRRVKDAVMLISTAIQIWVNVLQLGFQAFQAFISPIVGFGKAVFDIFEKIKSGKATLQDLFNLDFLKTELGIAGQEIKGAADGIKNTILGIGDSATNAAKQLKISGLKEQLAELMDLERRYLSGQNISDIGINYEIVKQKVNDIKKELLKLGEKSSAGGEVSTGPVGGSGSTSTSMNESQSQEVRLQKLLSYWNRQADAAKKYFQDYGTELNQSMAAELSILDVQSKQKIIQAQGNAEKIKEIEKEKEIQIDRIKSDYAKKEEERQDYLKNTRLQMAQQTISAVSTVEQGFSSIFSGLSSNRSQEIENEQILRTNALQASLDQGLISEEEYATQKKAIDKDISRKQAEQKRKDAEMNKTLKIFEIGINTASAIVNALATGGPPWLSIPLSIAIGALGAVQMGIAAGMPLPEIPAFAKGVSNFIGGAALVGEQGPEIVNLPMGSSVIPNNGLSSFGDAMNARAYTAQAVSGNSYDNRNMSNRTFNFNGTIVANDPQSFFEQMQQYLRENEGIA